jgi:hypothetical protein
MDETEVEMLAKQLFVVMMGCRFMPEFPADVDWEYDLAEEAFDFAKAFLIVRDQRRKPDGDAVRSAASS